MGCYATRSGSLDGFETIWGETTHGTAVFGLRALVIYYDPMQCLLKIKHFFLCRWLAYNIEVEQGEQMLHRGVRKSKRRPQHLNELADRGGQLTAPKTTLIIYMEISRLHLPFSSSRRLRFI